MPKKTKLAKSVLRAAKAQKITIATAESCTSGWIAKSLTDPAGASAVYRGGVAVYANEAKISLLNVPQQALEAHGAVSSVTAKHMAEGILHKLNVDMAISVTGIAGPGGATPNKPVGTVWFGLAIAGQPTQTIIQHFGNKGRDNIRRAATIYALEWLLESLQETQE